MIVTFFFKLTIIAKPLKQWFSACRLQPLWQNSIYKNTLQLITVATLQ